MQHPRGVWPVAQARYSTRRLPIERKTSTYTRRSQTVSTVRSRRPGSTRRAPAGTRACPDGRAAAPAESRLESTLRERRRPHGPLRRRAARPFRRFRAGNAVHVRETLAVLRIPSDPLSQFYCARCGYGISVRRVPDECPMCRMSEWKPVSPGQSRDSPTTAPSRHRPRRARAELTPQALGHSAPLVAGPDLFAGWVSETGPTRAPEMTVIA
jgi:rubrerythrin